MGAFNVVIASVLLLTKRPVLISSRRMHLIMALWVSPMVLGTWINAEDNIESWVMRVMIVLLLVGLRPFFIDHVLLYGLSDLEARRVIFNCLDRLGYTVRERLGKIVIKEIGEEISISTGWLWICRIQSGRKSSGKFLESLVIELRKNFRAEPAKIIRPVCYQFLVVGTLAMIFCVVLAIQSKFLTQF